MSSAPRPPVTSISGVLLALVPTLTVIAWVLLFVNGAEEAARYTESRGGDTTGAQIAAVPLILAVLAALAVVLLGLVVQVVMALARVGEVPRAVVSSVVHALIGGWLLLVTLVFSALLLQPDGVRQPGATAHLEYVGCLLLALGSVISALAQVVVSARRRRVE